jgi:hypothetical protein
MRNLKFKIYNVKEWAKINYGVERKAPGEPGAFFKSKPTNFYKQFVQAVFASRLGRNLY